MEIPRVEIVSKKMIKPSIPTPNHLQNFHISLFDQLAPPMYVHILFYFLPHRQFSRLQMEKSLSRALNRFCPLAGRFVIDDLSIRCADQGVDYFEASVDGANLQDLIKKTELEDVLHRFLPWDHLPPANSATSPLLAVQISMFRCRGFVLGLQISHVVADAFSMMAFIREWAFLSNDCMISERSLSSYDNNNVVSVFPTRALPDIVLPRPVLNLARVATTGFVFDEAMISNKASSRVVMVLALIWKALIRVSARKHGQLFRDSAMALSMNLRGKCRADLPISELCFGNFWIPVLVRAKREENHKSEFQLEELMMLLQDAITSTSERVVQAGAEEISCLLMNSRMAVYEELQCSGDSVDVYICTSWCRLDMYGVDFGWGKPCWVSQASKPMEGVVLMDAESGNGIEAWISLNENDMIELKCQLPVSVSNRT